MNKPFNNFNAKINGRHVKSQKELIETLQEEINKVTYVPSETVCEDVVEEETETTCENVDMSNIDNIKQRIEEIDNKINRTDVKCNEVKNVAETLRLEHNATLEEIVKLQSIKESLINEKIDAIQELHDVVEHNLSTLNERLEREETIIDSLTDEELTKLYESVDELMNIFTSLTKPGTN